MTTELVVSALHMYVYAQASVILAARDLSCNTYFDHFYSLILQSIYTCMYMYMRSLILSHLLIHVMYDIPFIISAGRNSYGRATYSKEFVRVL